eukprot:CAMPEP_0184693344 /NCGR_PEP_ID=MMETSP0313-20130426/1587_1 /TAXON_ID=2792 /ORGANISM="Porphyridium aerugineum, Strain SAG 1380-2" /LENGTH=461 /DNA_ID=CAMNT_0027151401 /DNA_START=290 /DNA_END=1675 /DNA_ORIENTATION=+
MPVKVGNYLIGETLGEGAFGKVKLGKHVETGEQFAVKIIEKKDIAANSMATNVKREISIMRALKHPNIVNFHEVLISKTSIFIIMDLVSGDELYNLMKKRGTLSERDAKQIFYQLINGVAYCHERGIYHRDLKPENILIDAQNTLKITDFGMSAMTGLVNEAGNPNALLYTTCGTLYYCAPEIMSSSQTGYSGDKVDAWSCGILLYLMLVGRLPFESEDMNTLSKLIQTSRVNYPKHLDPKVVDLLAGLLEKDPQKRMTVSQALQHPWLGGKGLPSESKPASQSTPILSSQISANPQANNSGSGAATLFAHSGSNPRAPSENAVGTSARSQAPLTKERSQDGGSMSDLRANSGHDSLVKSRSQHSNGSEETDIHAKIAALSIYHGFGSDSMLRFMKDTMHGKSEDKILETVKKLADADMDCIEDLEALALELNDKTEFKTWLTKEAGIPTVTAMRIAQKLF